MRFSSLSEWLNWQEGLHPATIELGLDRVRQVFKRLYPLTSSSISNYAFSPPCPVITVAGTNGKGSSVALLESIYQKAGYRTGAFTSPHLLRYNERIHLNGDEVSDEKICESFERIDQARLQDKETTLSYFEFGTLAALDIFFCAEPDVIILGSWSGWTTGCCKYYRCGCCTDYFDWYRPYCMVRRKQGNHRQRKSRYHEKRPSCYFQ